MGALHDTIVAPLTGAWSAPVGLLRISGPGAWCVASKVFEAWPERPQAMRVYYGRYVTGDDGLVTLFREQRSYTGDETAELSCHGSLAAVRALLDATITAGARLAEPGEFTQRAFMNGRIDLTEAEAVRDTIAASTQAQLRLANSQRDGATKLEFAVLRERVLGLLSSVEATVDFEEEIGPMDRDVFQSDLRSLIARFDELLATANLGRIMRQGLRIAIVGPPNAGKSSLFNALLKSDRTIVSATPGTTRDYVEEKLDLGGVPVVLIDTAGIRRTSDPVEALGVQRSRAQASCADLIWYVYDASVGYAESDRTAVRSFDSPVTTIANKCDLKKGSSGHLDVSSKTGQGFAELTGTVARFATDAASLPVPPLDPRHAVHLGIARDFLCESELSLANGCPPDLLAVQLRSAASTLGEVTGETATADMIERIFRDFCVGK